MNVSSDYLPHFNLGRRALLTGAAALAASAALPQGAAAQALAIDSLRDLKRIGSKRIDARYIKFADPELAMKTGLRMEHGLIENRAYAWWYYFDVFGVAKGKRPVFMLRYEGLEMIEYRRVPGVAEYQLLGHGHNVSFPIDNRIGDWVTRWTNPITGQVFEDVPDNVLDWDPGRIYTPRGDIDASHPERGVRPFDKGFHVEDGYLHRDQTRNAPVEWPGIFIESNSIMTPIADLMGSNPVAPSTRGGGVWVNPFFPWMNMNNVDGHVVAFFRGRKLSGVEQLPQRFYDRMQDRYPQLLSVDPAKFDGSWFRDPAKRTKSKVS